MGPYVNFKIIFLFFSLLFFFFKFNRMIFVLIGLEFLFLSLFFFFIFFLNNVYLLFFLVFCVFSSTMGVVLLSGLLNFFGNDYIFFCKFKLT